MLTRHCDIAFSSWLLSCVAKRSNMRAASFVLVNATDALFWTTVALLATILGVLAASSLRSDRCIARARGLAFRLRHRGDRLPFHPGWASPEHSPEVDRLRRVHRGDVLCLF
jgi:hypothetical protein